MQPACRPCDGRVEAPGNRLGGIGHGAGPSGSAEGSQVPFEMARLWAWPAAVWRRNCATLGNLDVSVVEVAEPVRRRTSHRSPPRFGW